MKTQNKILSILSSPYFYILFFVNVAFLMVQLLKQKRISDEKADIAKVALTVDNATLPANLFPSIKLEMRLDTFIRSTNSESIVLRLIKNDCEECEDSLINNTIRLAKRFGKQNVSVLVDKSYDNDEFATFKRLYQFDFGNIYYITDKVTTFDIGHVSYYFVLIAK